VSYSAEKQTENIDQDLITRVIRSLRWNRK